MVTTCAPWSRHTEPVPEPVLHHESAGDEGAPVLLLGCSLGTAAAMWEPQVAPLAEHLRVIRYDHRGHGASPVPAGPYEIEDLGRDVIALMDRLSLERASVGGVSLGGMVGIWLGAYAPDRVERLVLCCTSAHLPPASGWADRAAAVRAAGTTEVVADAVVERWLTPAFAEAQPETRAWLRAMLLAADAEGYAACCGAIERMDLRDALPSIAAPTLVVSAADDQATPPEHQRLLAGAIPSARLATVGPAAHIVNVERADEVTELILGHLLS
jgi:3-oxoadipate enol-lactonase